VDVVTYQPIYPGLDGPKREDRGNLRITRIGWIKFPSLHKKFAGGLTEFLYFAPPLFLYSLIYSMRHRKEIDVINAHGILSAFIAYFIRLITGKKTVACIHWVAGEKASSLAKSVYVKILNRTEAVLTLSEASREDLVRSGVSEAKVKVFRYWVDQDKFTILDKQRCRSELGLPPGFIVLFVGRLVEEKGVELVLESARRLKSHDDLVFVIIGDGPLKENVTKETSALPNLLYLGAKENSLLPSYYNAADVLLVPSTYEEGFGRVIIEALSTGLPVIGSNRGGIKEALSGLPVARLIEPTAEIISSEILKMKSIAKSNDVRKICRAYAVENFSKSQALAIEDALLRTASNDSRT
jgi:glycosyltransferase involved in cell wall biosynthesis